MKIEFSNEKAALIMKIDGEIDHRYATRIRREADRKIVTYPEKTFIIDLSGVSFMDSSAIGVIIGRYKLVKSFGSEVLLVSCSESVGKILSMSGIKKIIKIFDTLPDALNNVQRKD